MLALAGTTPSHEWGESVPVSNIHMRFVGLLRTRYAQISSGYLDTIVQLPSPVRVASLPRVVGWVVSDNKQTETTLGVVPTMLHLLKAVGTDAMPTLLPLADHLGLPLTLRLALLELALLRRSPTHGLSCRRCNAVCTRRGLCLAFIALALGTEPESIEDSSHSFEQINEKLAYDYEFTG